ncbi:MAG: PPC domain-containing protein, partial [Chloroflexota bacterium]
VDGEADDETVEYEIELEEGQEIEISVESDDFDTYLKLFDEDGDEVASDDDGGEGLNSTIEYEVEEDGTYIIEVGSFPNGSDATGDFELSVEETGNSSDDDDDEEAEEEDEDSDSGDADMAIGEEIEVDTDDLDELEVTFEAEEGDVVTILVRPEADIDVTVQLLDPDGDEIALFDGFRDPAIIRQLLEDDGLYTIVLEERDGDELDDEIEIEILEAEILDLNDGPQTVTLDANYQIDYMVFEAEEDVQYVLSITTEDTPDSTVYVDLLQEGEFFASTRATVAGMSEAAFIFEFNDDGDIEVEIEYFAFSGDEAVITIEITELGN